jgi:glycosyltransferase involved in cell wall biosynthesis
MAGVSVGLQGGRPRVSVVMPAYNAAEVIRESIDSVLAQTLHDFELLVVDDASTDQTVQVVSQVQDPRVVLMRLPRNQGAIGARNAGIEAARGQYIALLDADDLSRPQRLQVQVDLLESSGADLCASNYERWNPATGQRKPGHQRVRDVDLRALLTVYCPIGNSTVMGRAEVFKRNPYDPAYQYAEDYELWTRMAAQGCRFIASPRLLVTYRLHEGQSSVQNEGRVHEVSDAVRAAYLRQLGIDAQLAPRKLPWRERLRVGPPFLMAVRDRLGRASVGANYEIYSRFQYRGNGLLTPFVRLERLLASLWARFSPRAAGPSATG